MKITFLTPGTGSYYCGACMRDNALAKSLLAAGHEVSMLPMYLPLKLDEEQLPGGESTPIFFGGINVYLQQKFSLFRHTPRWVDRLLNRPGLLRQAARHSHMTSARDHGELALAMLRVDESRLVKELEKLIAWLEKDPPEVLCLSTALQAGMIRQLKKRLGVRVICCFQGEDEFLDALPEPFREECWRELRERVGDADALVSPSEYYSGLIRERLGEGSPQIEVLPNGIDLTGFRPASLDGKPSVIGFLARMIPDKGFDVLVDAFIHLRTELGDSETRLHVAGAVTADDQRGVGAAQERLRKAGLADSVEWSMNVSREEKLAILRSLTLFSVPAIYHEAFGLYAIEAMACGVPLVQPDAASFPEIVGESGAGLLVEPGDPEALARGWQELLKTPEKLREMGECGRRAARESYAVDVMSDRFVTLVG